MTSILCSCPALVSCRHLSYHKRVAFSAAAAASSFFSIVDWFFTNLIVSCHHQNSIVLCLNCSIDLTLVSANVAMYNNVSHWEIECTNSQQLVDIHVRLSFSANSLSLSLSLSLSPFICPITIISID